jgi:organic radical activating enzyme
MTEIYTPTISERESMRMNADEFKVSGDGVFFTIQGEGQSIGKPAVFLRLNFCNLQCGWCDTKYTWDRKSKEFWQDAENWDYQKTLSEIERYPVKRLVITGGEPLIQQERISKFVDLIPSWDIEIETNGTIPPTQTLADKCQFNVSPKLENSGNALNRRYKPEVLSQFNELPNTTFKFVVKSERDLDEISQLVEDCSLDPSKIIIMPEGTTDDDIKTHALEVVEGVKERGWRLTPRLHVLLWGDKRGI